jgi:hypothetical protein
LRNITQLNSEKIYEYYDQLPYLKKYKFKLGRGSGEEIPGEELIKREIPPEIPIVPRLEFPNTNNNNICACGRAKNRVKYNYCQKCNKIY